MGVYDTGGRILPLLPLGPTQDITFAASSGAVAPNGTAFLPSTQAILIVTDAAQRNIRLVILDSAGVRVNSGSNAGTKVLKGAMIMTPVPAGGSITVISDDLTGGSVNVTELRV